MVFAYPYRYDSKGMFFFNDCLKNIMNGVRLFMHFMVLKVLRSNLKNSPYSKWAISSG